MFLEHSADIIRIQLINSDQQSQNIQLDKTKSFITINTLLFTAYADTYHPINVINNFHYSVIYLNKKDCFPKLQLEVLSYVIK